MNLLFISQKEDVEGIIKNNQDIVHTKGKYYVYTEEHKFWIDLEIQDTIPKRLSFRITLCNPKMEVLSSLFKLLTCLFESTQGVLIDLKTKEQFDRMNDITMKSIENSYDMQKKVFISLYGDISYAIGSDELSTRRQKSYKKRLNMYRD